MGEKLINSIISVVVGCFSAIGTVWFLDAEPQNTEIECKKYEQLEVDSLRINHDLTIYSPQESQNPLIEMKNGLLYVQNGVYSENIGALRIIGQKIQMSPGDPTSLNPPVFSELSTNEDGGAYFALLSPKGTHSMNFGFDKMETGFIISQNNQDHSMVAQAILPIPQAQDIHSNENPVDSTVLNNSMISQEINETNQITEQSTNIVNDEKIQLSSIESQRSVNNETSHQLETAISTDISDFPKTIIQ